MRLDEAELGALERERLGGRRNVVLKAEDVGEELEVGDRASVEAERVARERVCEVQRIEAVS